MYPCAGKDCRGFGVCLRACLKSIQKECDGYRLSMFCTASPQYENKAIKLPKMTSKTIKVPYFYEDEKGFPQSAGHAHGITGLYGHGIVYRKRALLRGCLGRFFVYPKGTFLWDGQTPPQRWVFRYSFSEIMLQRWADGHKGPR